MLDKRWPIPMLFKLNKTYIIEHTHNTVYVKPGTRASVGSRTIGDVSVIWQVTVGAAMCTTISPASSTHSLTSYSSAAKTCNEIIIT